MNKCKTHHKECNIFCCKYVSVKMQGRVTLETLDWFKLHNIIKFGDMYYIPCKCNWFDDEKRGCKYYDKRPDDCKHFQCIYLVEGI